MNTLIELYDKEPIENIYAALAFRPEQVVFLGDSRLMTRERQEHLKLFFKQQQLKTKLFFYPLRGEDTQQIERTFLQVAERFPDGVVDVTGGTDLLLVTAGKLCERAEMPVIFFNVRTGELVPLGKKTGLGDFSAPALTVQSLLTLAGGAYLRHGHYTTGSFSSLEPDCGGYGGVEQTVGLLSAGSASRRAGGTCPGAYPGQF